MQRFKLPNNIFSLNLKSNELIVYAYLCSLAQTGRLDRVIVKYDTIAQKCGYKDTGSVFLIIKSLSEKGLIQKRNRYRYDGTFAANMYKIRNYGTLSSRFFFIGRGVFEKIMSLGKSPAAIYLYLCKCVGGRSYAFPSLRKMKEALRMSISTVTAGIKALVKEKLIRKVRYIKKDRGFSCNQYYFCDATEISESDAKRETRQRTKRVSLNRLAVLAQRLFLPGGALLFPKQFIDSS